MPKKKYDVIVAGAGPAGTTAASYLAGRGCRVLMIDRAGFPRDKICGDGIPPGTVTLLQQIGAGQQIEQAGFFPIHGFRFVTPRGTVFDTAASSKNGQDFFIAPRRKFDHILFEHALGRGAEFLRAQITGPLLADGRVAGVRLRSAQTERELAAPMVIAADGATSAIARGLSPAGAETGQPFLATRAYVTGLQTLSHKVEFHFTDELWPGYGWVFPLSESSANVGVGLLTTRYRRDRVPLHRLLERFLNSRPFRDRLLPDMRTEQRASWPIPMAFSRRFQRAFPGALLVGDAARLVDPLSGEGIHNAVQSALLAAQVTFNALQQNPFSGEYMDEYNRLCARHVWPVLSRSLLLQKGMLHTPFLVEGVFRLANLNHKLLSLMFSAFSQNFKFSAG